MAKKKDEIPEDINKELESPKFGKPNFGRSQKFSYRQIFGGVRRRAPLKRVACRSSPLKRARCRRLAELGAGDYRPPAAAGGRGSKVAKATLLWVASDQSSKAPHLR